MKSTIISLTGKIHFDPENKTKKHENQSSWKKVALVLFEGEICEYYCWFLKRRFHLYLNKPLRGAHVTFINDKVSEITGTTFKEKNHLWDLTAAKWETKEITLSLDLDIRTNTNHWWFNLTEESRNQLQEIRNELGLPKPYFGLHMTIGIANEKNINHSRYIHQLLVSSLSK